MSIWGALGFMALGAMVSELYNFRAWGRYREGKQEGRIYGTATRRTK